MVMKYNRNCKICNKEFSTNYSKKITCSEICKSERVKELIKKRKYNKKYYNKYCKEYYLNEKKIREQKEKENIIKKYGDIAKFFMDFADNYHLSKSEYIIFLNRIQGFSNDETAKNIRLVDKTSKFHMTNVFRKTKCKNMAQLSFKAFTFKHKIEIPEPEITTNILPQGVNNGK